MIIKNTYCKITATTILTLEVFRPVLFWSFYQKGFPSLVQGLGLLL
jgi:hypothetical protein